MTTLHPQPGTLADDDTTQPKCFVCDKTIVDGRWFGKIFQEAKPIVLCCPRCALRYFDTLHPTANGGEQDYTICEQSLQFLVGEEKP